MEKKHKDNLSRRDFLQSDFWREFQASLGRETFLVVEGDFCASIIEHKLPLAGRYFYLPHGPKFSSFEKENQVGWQAVVDLALKRGVGWIRIEPGRETDLNWLRKMKEKAVRKAAINVQPKETLTLDLEKEPAEILKEMKAKTRYNIKLAEKKGVLIKTTDGDNQKKETVRSEAVGDFIRLTKVTAKRNNIKSHSEEYYQKMCQMIPGNILKIFTAEYQGKIIAANLVVFFEKTAIYLHGASDDQYRNVMAPFLLQWEQIKEAKRRGCREYDFGGVAIKTANPAWQGITRFKAGFCPKTESFVFPGTFDFVLSGKKYSFYLFAQKIKRIF